MALVTRKNLRSALIASGQEGISREKLIEYFKIKADDTRVMNRFFQTIEAERRAGLLEIGLDGKYRHTSNTNEPVNDESVLSVS